MKTVLIVDDSRVARAVLRKTLVGFGIEVDEVPTAEAAFEYLKVDFPDVIFLDHMMPGMDGFDALSVLKANPATATIPVLMYTAQEGQFYVSQARALGAVDILPKSLAPADVERILRSHHLIDEPRWTLVDGEEPGIDGHHELIERFRTMLDERVVTLLPEFRREMEHVQSASETRLHRIVAEYRPTPTPSFSARLAIGSSVAVLALAVTVGIPYFPEKKSSADVLELPAVIRMDTEAASPAIEETPVALETTESEQMAISDDLRGWSTTQPYQYGAVPLDDVRALEYALLFAQLKSDGFTGTVTFDIYEGRHCIDYLADGSTQLAPPNQLATSCDYIGTARPGAGAPLQSPMFAKMVAFATRDGQIRVDTVLHGTEDPIIGYPALDYSVSAADWNSIADINQRVSMRVRHEDADNSREPVAFLSH